MYLTALLPFGSAAFIWAIWKFPVDRVDAPLVGLACFTIFFSSYLRIQLPRTKIHLTISDALVFLSLLVYGGEVAVLLAILETSFTSFNFRRQGVSISARTAGINILITAVSVFATALTLSLAFGGSREVISRFSSTNFVFALGTMALSQFLVNSILVSAFVAIKSDSTLWRVWNDYCLNALVIYLCGSAMAGISAMALAQINVYLFASVSLFFALVYFTYRRYVNDVKSTSARAEEAERNRADQAERHVEELQHYVTELEKSGEALRESREKFRHAAYHEALTGLPNRNYIFEALRRYLEEAKADPKKKFAVLFLNLNRFRTINESLGHDIGDKVIRQVAKRLDAMVSDGDVAGHFGGDEFALILPKISDPEVASRIANALTKRIAQSIRLKGREVFTTASIGIVFGSHEYTYAEDILRDADIALYNAKDKKKDCVVFDSAMYEQVVERQQMETDLRYAIVCNELEVFYQPIVRLDDCSIRGVEALVRWNHPRRGLISPAEFIPIAESTGLINPLTIQVLQNSCTQLAQWNKRLDPNSAIMLSVNLSGTNFGDPELVSQIERIMRRTGISPSSLKLEITESAVMENAESAIEMLKRIKETGVSISIDDFGTGYSSLSYLHKFPIDYLKIDRSFVTAMDDADENREIVRTIVALAKALKLSIIAEGIETIEQCQRLNRLGCEYGQGYLFARPLPLREIEELIFDGFHLPSLSSLPSPSVRSNVSMHIDAVQ